jgi:PAS domain S-box-containing protein
MSRRARALVAALVTTAAVTAAAVAVLDPEPTSWLTVVALAAAIAVGDALAVDLPFRRAGDARFALGDVSLAAGLMLAAPNEVVLAAAAAAVTGQVVERQPVRRLAFNVSQFVTATSVGAAVILLSGAQTGVPSVHLFAAAAIALALFSVVNTLSVASILALTSDATWRASVLRIAPTAALLAVGSAALGLLAVLLLDTYAWALGALAIPLGLLYMASRQEVRAQLERERSTAYASVEQTLGELATPESVALALVEGTTRILGCRTALWMEGRWLGAVPEGSAPCPVDPDLATPLVTRGPSLGPHVETACAAIGVGGGVLVVWRGELGLAHDTEAWLERLARSGRAHFERATAASALAQEQATLRAVVDGTGDGICVLDSRGTVRLWNPAMARLSGVPGAEAVDTPVWQVLGEGPWTSDGVHDVSRDDGERTWRVSVSSVHHREGALRVALVHDVTAERRLARMKDDMLAVVSHELRTPLTPIKASAQLLRRRWERMGETDRDNLLERIEERADHLTRLVADILLVAQLSAADRPVLEITPTETDLAALLHELVAAQRAAHHTHDLGLTTPDVVHATTDPVRVRQVLENLIDNACKFSQPGARVDITLAVGNGQATLRVVDEGRGIPPDQLERIFERFERVEDPLVMTTSGAGLGLYIVRELVTALGGSVTIDSTPGHGTTVAVRLPLHAAQAGHQDTAGRGAAS